MALAHSLGTIYTGGSASSARSLGSYVADPATLGGSFPPTASAYDAYLSLTGRGPTNCLDYASWSNQGFVASQGDACRAKGSLYHCVWEPSAGINPDASWTLASLTAGNHDAYINQFISDAKAWGHPFFLRFAHEMNGNWYPWGTKGGNNGNSPADYVAAWRYVHNKFTAAGCTNPLWVWSPNILGSGQDASTYAALYPGDAYVDWIALDGYNEPTTVASYLQNVPGTAPSASGTTISYTASGNTVATTVGSMMLAMTSSGSPNCTCSGMADNAGNSWTKVGAAVNPSGGETSLWYAMNGVSKAVSGYTVTATFANAGGAAVSAGCGYIEFSGMAASPLDAPSVATAHGTGTAVSLTTGALAGSHEMVFALVSDPSSGTSYPIPAQSGPIPWHTQGTAPNLPVEREAYSLREAAPTSAVTLAVTTGASVNWSGVIAAFKTTGNGPTWQSFTQVFAASYDAVTSVTSKPLMIAEMGCSEYGGDKAAWIASAFTTEIPNRFPLIQLVNWFDKDKSSSNDSSEADWRVNSTAAALAAYKSVSTSDAWSGSLGITP